MTNINEIIKALGGVMPVSDLPEFIPVAESELRLLEKQCNGTIPEPYRSFLLKFGACHFIEEVECVSATPLPLSITSDNRISFSSLFGGDSPQYGTQFTLSHAMGVYKGRMPDTVIPIGNDSGNKICIGVGGSELGKVYYWDHNNEWDEEDYEEEYDCPMPPQLKFQNLHLLAHSFDDFLSRMRIVK